MDLGSAVASGKKAVDAGITVYKGWGKFKKWWYGKIDITHPQNRENIKPGYVEIKGTHQSNGNFWLLANEGYRYWPKCRINLQPDGRWKENVHIGDHPGPRTTTIILVRMDNFIQSLFQHIINQMRILNQNRITNCWEIEIKDFPQDSIVQAIVLDVI